MEKAYHGRLVDSATYKKIRKTVLDWRHVLSAVETNYQLVHSAFQVVIAHPFLCVFVDSGKIASLAKSPAASGDIASEEQEVGSEIAKSR